MSRAYKKNAKRKNYSFIDLVGFMDHFNRPAPIDELLVDDAQHWFLRLSEGWVFKAKIHINLLSA